jgi:hypothetical protein
MNEPLARIRLTFDDEATKRKKRASACLSGIEQIGDDLYVVGDEGVSLHRLSPDGNGGYANPERFDLIKLFGLDDDPKNGEADLEGLCRDGDWLWVCGSHSRKRAAIEAVADAAALADHAKTKLEKNRLLLGRMPLIKESDRRLSPRRKAEERSAACFKIVGKKTALTEALRSNRLLGPFMDIPSKEGGLDIEAIAARGETVLIGLRGPVLRGNAVVVRFAVRQQNRTLHMDESDGLTIHLLDLDGLGVRDLAVDGEDILVLTGPTMQLDGPSLVFRWHDAFKADEGLVNSADVERLLALPYGYRSDHAEGICVLRRRGRPHRLAVVYDSPAASRSDGGGAYIADVFALPA